MEVRAGSEQETFPSIPSTLPDTIEEEPVGLDSLEFSQHGDVGKSAKKVGFLYSHTGIYDLYDA